MGSVRDKDDQTLLDELVLLRDTIGLKDDVEFVIN